MARSHLLFLGTYTRTGTSRGIYAVRLDGESGALSAPELVAETPDPGWLTFSPDRQHLYAIHASPGQALAYRVDAPAGRLTALSTLDPAVRAGAPCHLVVDATGRTLLAANYGDGYVAAIPIRADATLGPPNLVRHAGHSVHPTRQEKPHVHSVTLSPDNRFVLVADLGLDRIYSYALDPATATLSAGPGSFFTSAPGAGPRHLKFGPDGTRVYVINELANTIDTCAYDRPTGTMTRLDTVPTLPPGYLAPSTAAEIRIHPNGRFVYGSNRGHDSIAVFAIAPTTGALVPVETVSTGGRNPRNFALSPDGRWLVCGHQDTPLLTVFRVDPATGQLLRTPHTAEVPTCICVLFHD